MDSERWPKNPEAAAALVALVLDDLQYFGQTDRDEMLARFLRAAWPSERAQRQ
ncbi:MAG: hypothetical protein ACJ77Z_16410 [Thermoleophilaceae bacterium]|jgi:hypothetical protein